MAHETQEVRGTTEDGVENSMCEREEMMGNCIAVLSHKWEG